MKTAQAHPHLGHSLDRRLQEEMRQKEQRKNNILRARKHVIDPQVRSPAVCEKALELFWLEVPPVGVSKPEPPPSPRRQHRKHL
eukprot:1072944-Amphidinium_carterae.1